MQHTTYEVIIIGSGFSGICSAIKLKENGIHNYLILERDEDLGGTWWKNTYPGAAVDVPSHLYSFSFEPYDWTRFFAKQEEILAYTQMIIKKHQLQQSSRCSVKIAHLKYLENEGIWETHLDSGEILRSTFIISGTGGLSQAKIPYITGQEKYKGHSFHSSNWDHSFDFTGKNVAVIGTGASAVQLVPELAKKAASLKILQRTPHWILPRPDRALHTWERKLLRLPFFNKLFRGITYLKSESRAIFFTKWPWIAKLVKFEALGHLKKQIKDEQLREKLTPDFDIGCKRVLLCNDYYPSLNQDNVELLTTSIQSINETGITLSDGNHHAVDLIVYATGFHAAEDSIPFEIIGQNNTKLSEYWKDGAFAYCGTTVSNFPNLFFAMGPNTGTGHTSVIYFIESQMNYIMDAIKQFKHGNWKSIAVQASVEEAYNQKLQKDLANTIWLKGGCKSWYLTTSGKSTTMFPNFSFVFRWQTRSFWKELHDIQA